MRIRRWMLASTVLVAGAALTGCNGHMFEWENDPPIVDALLANAQETTAETPLTIAKGLKIVFACRAHDDNTDNLTYTWSLPAWSTAAESSGPSIPESPSPDTPDNVKEWTPTGKGTYTVTCTVTDGRGGTAQQAAYVKVLDPTANTAPTATVAPAATTVAPGSDNTAFVCNASDFDGDPITYAWFASAGTATRKPDDQASATYKAPDTAGEYLVYCIVSDGKGAYATAVARATVVAP